MDIDLKKFKKDFVAGYTYKQLSKKYNITFNQVKVIIRREKLKRTTARLGNQNAKGNKTPTKFKKGNKAALKTGEYETLNSKYFDKEELEILNSKIDVFEELQNQINVLKIREYRILGRIKDLKEKKELSINRIVRTKALNAKGEVIEDETISEAENTIMMIQKLEASLTRVQEARRKAIKVLYEMNLNDNASEDDEKSSLSLLESINRQLKNGDDEND